MLFLAYTVFLAIIFAKVEINIEGQHGWAGKLPTWRLKNSWTKLFLGDKELTGYHLYIWILLIALFHLPVIVLGFNLILELKIILAYAIFIDLEDFFWFVLNPHYGLKKFKKGQIPWHKDWLGPVPKLYWVHFAFILSLFALINYLGG